MDPEPRTCGSERDSRLVLPLPAAMTLGGVRLGLPKSAPAHHPLTLQVSDHGLVFVLELGQALRFLFLFREVGGELSYPVFQQLLLLGARRGGGGGRGVRLGQGSALAEQTLPLSSKYGSSRNPPLNGGTRT